MGSVGRGHGTVTSAGGPWRESRRDEWDSFNNVNVGSVEPLHAHDHCALVMRSEVLLASNADILALHTILIKLSAYALVSFKLFRSFVYTSLVLCILQTRIAFPR